MAVLTVEKTETKVQTQTSGNGAVVPPVKVTASSGKIRGDGTGNQCLCGCGEYPVGGRFCMGHDARLKGKLRKIVLMGGDKADQAAKVLIGFGWYDAAGIAALRTGKASIDPAVLENLKGLV